MPWPPQSGNSPSPTAYTDARAGYLDELAAANIPADVDTLIARLTAARAALLDEITAVRLAELNAANIPADVDTLNTKAGTNVDAAGTTTLFARLRQIVDTYLADGTVGLAAIETLVDDLEGAVGAIEGATTLHNKLTAARAALIDQITALRMAELDAANIPADVDTLLTRLSALRAGYLDNLSGGAVALAASWTAALATALGNYTAARAGYLDELAAANVPADIDTLLTRLSALRAGYLDELDFDLVARLGTPAGASLAADLLTIDNLVDDLEGRLTAARAADLDFALKVIEVSVTSAANAGLVTVATVTAQPCQIESIVVHADAAQTADMTTCAVKGGVSQVVTFIGTGDATQANLDAADKQVGWSGVVRLAATKTIVIDLQGTGATAVDLTVTITYRSCIAGGSLT